MNNEQAIEIAKEYFPHYPSVNEFHVTCDGQVFELKHMAENHVKSMTHKDNWFVFSVKKSGEQDFSATMDSVPVTPLVIGVPNNATVHAEVPATVVVTTDKDAQKAADEAAKAAADKANADKEAADKIAADKAAKEKKAAEANAENK